MDFNASKRLEPAEFEQALSAFGLFPKKVELQALIKYYDTDGNGTINFEEFVRGLRDDLSDRRARMVNKAFSVLDSSNQGAISISDVINIYDVSMNPEFIEGKKTKD